MHRFAALLCVWVLGLSAPSTSSASGMSPDSGQEIRAGDEIMDALTSHGQAKVYEVTAPSDGTLLVRVTWNPGQGHIELDLAYTAWSGNGVIVARQPVIAGGKYSVIVADGAPWDYDELFLPFVLTVSMEPEPESVLYDFVAIHSQKCLDVSGASLDNGAPLIQWSCHGGDNQLWSVAPGVDGYVQIISRNSGQCLDVSGGSVDDGAAVIQWPCHGGANQQWLIQRLDSGFMRITARHSGKCLDVYAASREDGASVIQWPCHGGENQSWLIRTR